MLFKLHIAYLLPIVNGKITMVEEHIFEQLCQWSEGSKRHVLGVIGLPGAGKSTLTAWIKQRLGESAVIVPMDGFHLANNQLERLGRKARKGGPDTFDTDGFQALLARIKSSSKQETIYAPAFHREIEESIAGEIAILPTVQLVIVEGNYLLLEESGWQGTSHWLDETWFIQVDERQRLKQLKQRHIHFGRTEAEAEQWIASTDQPNAELIQTTAIRADKHIVIKQ